MKLLVCSVLAFLALGAVPRPLHAQDRDLDVALREFVHHVARVWHAADVPALVTLIPEETSILLDAGAGTESANSRHAAAALRALFSELESVDAAAVRATLTSTTPPGGFGELSWTFTARGAPIEQVRSVYVAALLVSDRWRITELRLMP